MISKDGIRQHLCLILFACSAYYRYSQDWQLSLLFDIICLIALFSYVWKYIDSSETKDNEEHIDSSETKDNEEYVYCDGIGEQVTLMAIGANPAYQECLSFDAFEYNEVNRARSKITFVGGKGQNCAKSACNLVPGCCMVAQFLGGHTGQQIRDLLKKLNVPQLTIQTNNSTRVCTTLKSDSDKTVTEIVGPSGKISLEEHHRFLSNVRKHVQGLKGAAICGSFPPGFQGQDYAEIALSLPEDCFLLLDSMKDPHPTLATGRVSLFKINEKELRTYHDNFNGGFDDLVAATLMEVDVKYLGVTRGSKPAFLYEMKDTSMIRHEFWVPKLQVQNTIGAGDTFNGAFLVAHVLQGKSVVESFKLGMAAASAKCQNMKGGGIFDVDLQLEIASKIEVSRDIFRQGYM